MRVCVDTNILLSGLFGRGLCAELLGFCVEHGLALLLDPRVREEFDRIAREKFGAMPAQLADAEAFFSEACHVVPEASVPLAGIPDPDDAWIIAAAHAAGADCFVTGDKALLALGQVEHLPILDVRCAYLRLRGLG